MIYLTFIHIDRIKNDVDEVGKYRLGYITALGLYHPLREPYVLLSEYTALLLFA
ncbi:hypothetical protein AT52_01884 [Streptococcus equi subsp. zooepidemicus Sz35]|nr:hypothetical protein AT52_01884 [Streptococcus equi subsp. zooepidemicus Sz35]